MIAQLLVVSLVVEALWENLKILWDDGHLNVDRLGAMVLGVLICLGVGINFFDAVGLPFIFPLVGNILSGVLVSRGANALHDLLKKFEALA